jgi:hypothetical protein
MSSLDGAGSESSLGEFLVKRFSMASIISILIEDAFF